MLPRRRRVLGRVLAAAGAAVLLGACQPVDSGDVPRDELEVAGTPAPPARGAPAGAGLPGDIGMLLDGLSTTAAQWQSGARPVELHVDLADGGTWTAARVLYLAPDADRFLLVTVTPEGTSQERPTLETLALAAVPAAALEQVPALPDALLEPHELAEVAAEPLDDCGFDDEVSAVLYASGAPASWDGDRWTETPAWSATVTNDDGSGVVVDPVTGAPEPGSCVDAA
jgi:hypothetical protein